MTRIDTRREGSLLPQVLLVGSGMWIGCLGTLTLLNLGVTFR